MFNQVLDNYNKKGMKNTNKTSRKAAVDYYQIWQF